MYGDSSGYQLATAFDQLTGLLIYGSINSLRNSIPESTNPTQITGTN